MIRKFCQWKKLSSQAVVFCISGVLKHVHSFSNVSSYIRITHRTYSKYLYYISYRYRCAQALKNVCFFRTSWVFIDTAESLRKNSFSFRVFSLRNELIWEKEGFWHSFRLELGSVCTSRWPSKPVKKDIAVHNWSTIRNRNLKKCEIYHENFQSFSIYKAVQTCFARKIFSQVKESMERILLRSHCRVGWDRLSKFLYEVLLSVWLENVLK